MQLRPHINFYLEGTLLSLRSLIIKAIKSGKSIMYGNEFILFGTFFPAHVLIHYTYPPAAILQWS